jgi:translocation and assembly module TamA
LKFSRLTCWISALVLASAGAGPALAFDFFGLKLFEGQQQADEAAVITDPQPYTLDFETGDAPGDVAGALQNASSLFADKDQPASGTPGLLAKARGDYRRLNSALYAQGYYGGVIHILIGGHEATGVAADAELPDPVAVKVVVAPGPLFRFGRLAITNRAPATVDVSDRVTSPEQEGFVPGAVAKSAVILTAEQSAINAWRQLGYPHAKSARREIIADHATDTVDVTLAIDPGPKAYIGAVSVHGTENMDPAFVAYQTGLHPGEEYDPDLIALANKRLTRLEVFRSTRIAEQGDIGPGGELPYDIIVQERPGHRFGFGADYSNIEGVGVNGYWLARNLFGEAERLRLDAKVANIGFPVNTAKFNYAFGATFTKPGVINPDTDLVANVNAEREVVPAYTKTGAEASVGLNYSFNDQLKLNAAVTGDRNQFEDSFGRRDFATLGIEGEAVYDTRNSTTDPTSGYYLDATIEPYYEFYFGNPQLRATGEARAYYGFGDADRFVIAGRVKAGALAGPSIGEVPPDKLFLAGGGGSVRGYPYKSIGVDDGKGGITGGKFLLEGSLEARAKIMDNWGAAAFIDAGAVGGESLPSPSDLKLGVGVGVRYYTGFGPIRADVAFPLDKRPGDPGYGIYLGLGQAF